MKSVPSFETNDKQVDQVRIHTVLHLQGEPSFITKLHHKIGLYRQSFTNDMSNISKYDIKNLNSLFLVHGLS